MLTNPIQVLSETELLGHKFTVYGTAENPLFLAKEVAECIDYAKRSNGSYNTTMMLQSVDEEEKVANIVDTPGGNQQVWFLTEDGLYEVLMQSRKPIAKEFKKGVKEILKTIRKTGGYIATKQDDTPEEIMARALTIAQATLAKREERLKQLEAQAEQQQATIEIQTEEIKKSAPKVSYYDNHLQSVNTQTSTQAAKQIGMDAEKLHKKLKENRNHLPTKRAVDITCALFDMGNALNPYTDVHTLGRFDRNKCIYSMDYQRCAFHYCSI